MEAVSENYEYKSARGNSQAYSFRWHYQEGHGFCKTCSTKFVFTANDSSRGLWLSVAFVHVIILQQHWLLTFLVSPVVLVAPWLLYPLTRVWPQMLLFQSFLPFHLLKPHGTPQRAQLPLGADVTKTGLWSQKVNEMSMCYTHWQYSWNWVMSVFLKWQNINESQADSGYHQGV